MLGIVGIFAVFVFLNGSVTVTPEVTVAPVKLEGKKPLILVYTPVFGRMQDDFLDGCPFADQCELTLAKDRMPESDAVVYHAYDFPDVFPFQKAEYHFKNVLYTQENPVSVIKNAKRSPHNFFHWIMSYPRASHLSAPYGTRWVDPDTAKRHGFPSLDLPYDAESIFANKSISGAFWLVSNCNTTSKRETAVAALAKHFRVDIAGKCGTDSNIKSLCSEPYPATCHEVYEKYYFFMALENADCVDYITEKYWSHYELPVVPIVMRRYVYEKLIPPGSFIAFDDYPSPKAMADHLTYLIGNQTAYLEYFKYREQGWTRAGWNSAGYTLAVCNLCEKLLSTPPMPMPPRILDVKKYFFKMAPCQMSQFTDKWSIQT
uniref:Fucosyltransferase n=1 Tax=Panagrellus redivivus TaxID=6233 RepID=A0A7E4VDT9_PANRE